MHLMNQTLDHKDFLLRNVELPRLDLSVNKEKDPNLVKLHKFQESVAKLNQQILDLQNELVSILDEKNDLMGDLNIFIDELTDLGYEERVILRVMISLGGGCSQNILDLLQIDEYTLQKDLPQIKQCIYVSCDTPENIDKFFLFFISIFFSKYVYYYYGRGLLHLCIYRSIFTTLKLN